MARYLNGGSWTLLREYVETESGKRSDRPKLAAALAHAKATGATVVFAKLDRLTRNVDLLRALVASGVDLVFCDLPHVPPGAMGRFLLTQMASVAELEAGLISERTKAALTAAKARGAKLGNPNGARALRGKQTGNAQAVAKIKANAVQRAQGLTWIVEDIKGSGITTVSIRPCALSRLLGSVKRSTLSRRCNIGVGPVSEPGAATRRPSDSLAPATYVILFSGPQ